MPSTRYSGFPCSIGGTDFTDVSAVRVNSNANRAVLTPSGSLDAGAIIINSATPTCSVETGDLTTVLGAVSISAGLNCTGGGTFRFQQRADGSTFTGSTSNGTIVSTKGFLGIGSISAQQDSPAQCSLNYWALFDGTNKPLVFTPNVDFTAAPAPLFVSKFWLGGVYYNSSQILGLKSVTVTPGLAYALGPSDGDVTSRIGSIIARNPKVSLTFQSLENLQTFGMFLSLINHPLAVYLQKGASGSDRVAAGTASHVKVSLSTGAWGPDDTSSSDSADAALTISADVIGVLAASVTSTIP